uniref:(northern house mosquito) hypothetical protein n=1 Tax=Culex pipiens TaxID=7175 RepID=A0A8D8D919_CULPI
MLPRHKHKNNNIALQPPNRAPERFPNNGGNRHEPRVRPGPHLPMLPSRIPGSATHLPGRRSRRRRHHTLRNARQLHPNFYQLQRRHAVAAVLRVRHGSHHGVRVPQAVRAE